MNERELLLRIKSMFDGKGFEAVESGLGKLGISANSMSQTVNGASKAVGVGMLAAGVAVGAIGLSSVNAAATFQAGMSNIQAVSGATAGEMETVRAKAMQIGADTAFSAQEAAMGMEELLKAGVDVKGVLGGAADATIALAAAGGVDLPTAASIASAAMNNFGLAANELPRVADLIAGAANASAISVEDFGMSMSASGAVANLAGVSLDDLAVAITAMGNAGIKGSDAGTSLKTMMMNMVPTTNTQIAAFRDLGLIYETGGEQIGTTEGKMKSAGAVSKELGASVAGMDKASKEAFLTQQFGAAAFDETGKKLRSMTELGHMAVKGNLAIAGSTQAVYAETKTHNLLIDDATGKLKPFGEIAGILSEKLKDLSDSEKMVALEAMFGSDAIRAAAVIADTGAAGWDKLKSSMGKVTADDVAATRLDNFAGSMDAFKGSIETVQIQLGEKLLPTLRLVVDAGSGIVNAFGAFISGDVEAAVTSTSGKMGEMNMMMGEAETRASGQTKAAQMMSEAFAKIGVSIDPSVFGNMFTAITDGVARIQAAFASAGGGEGLAGSMVKAITGVVDVIVFLVENPAIAKLAAVFLVVLAAVAPVGAALSFVAPIVGTLVTAFTGLAALLGGPVTIAIAAVGLAILLWKEWGDEITAWVTEWGGKFIQSVKDIFGIASPSQVFMDLGIDLFMGLVNGLVATAQAVLDVVIGLGASLLAKWSETKDGMLSLVENTRVMISAKWDTIREYLNATMEGIKSIAQGAIDAFGKSWQDGLAFLSGLIDSALVGWQKIIGDGLDWIEEKTGVSMDGVRRVFDTVIGAVRQVVSDGVALVIGLFEGLGRSVGLVVGSVQSLLAGDFAGALAGMQQAAQTAIAAVVGFFSGLGRSILSAIGSARDMLAGVGRDIVGGLESGVKAAWNIFWGWVTNTFGSMAAKIRELLGGGHSPIPTFIPVGEDIVGGLSVGMLNGFKANPIGRMLADWVAAIKPGEVGSGIAIRMDKAISPALGSHIAMSWAKTIAPALGAAIAIALTGGQLGPSGGMTGMRAGPMMDRGGAVAGNIDGIMGQNNPLAGKGPGVIASGMRGGKGGLLAASKSNYWQVFVNKWGVPEEGSARKTAAYLGIPLPEWLEMIYNPPQGDRIDAPGAMKDPEAAAMAMGKFGADFSKAAGEVIVSMGNVVIALDKLVPLRPGPGQEVGFPPGGGGIGIPIPGPGQPIVADKAEIKSVALTMNQGETRVYIDGKELGRGAVKAIIDNPALLDELGKKIGERRAAKTS